MTNVDEVLAPIAAAIAAKERHYSNLHEAGAKAFAKVNGWRWSEDGFRLADLGRQWERWDGMMERWMDHPLFFRRRGINVAVGDAKEDRDMPDARSWEELERHLYRIGACDAAIKAGREVWAMFQRQREW
jgi:hypothetical protein